MRIVEENWKVLASLFPAGMGAGMTVGCGRAIAWVSIARGAVADTNAACRAGLLVAGDAVRAGWRTGPTFRMSPCLSVRECEVMSLVVSGMLNKQIAANSHQTPRSPY